MSLIGPRPPLTYHPWPIEEYTKEQLHMFDVRPGFSGWAQIHGRKDVEWNHEFFRELLMNVFLYFPLGLTLGELIGWHRIWLALVLAIVIESWQYAAGTGMAQVTDVICNTLGAWIGGIAFQKRKHCL